MPIRLEMLEEGEKANVAVKGNTTWAMAAAALKQKGGDPSWPLVVKKADGFYVAATYATILNAGDIPPNTQAEALPGLVPVQAVELDSMSTKQAQDHVAVLKSPQLIVAVNQGKYVGAIKGIGRTGGELPTAKLNELAGKQTDLAKLGDFLLDEA